MMSVKANIDDKCQGIAFDNIDFQTRTYKMTVYLPNRDQKIKLMQFQKELHI